MIKVVFIEDRTPRKEQFIEKVNLHKLHNYNFIKMIEEVDYVDFKIELANNSLDQLHEASVIIAHKSAFSHSEQDILKKFCNNSKTPLVFFSGGISGSSYQSKPFPYLNINSKNLYSDHLIYFLDSIEQGESVELLKLQFGRNWELNNLLSYRDVLARYIYKSRIEAISSFDKDDLDFILAPGLEILLPPELFNKIEQFSKQGIKEDGINKLTELKHLITNIVRNKIGLI